MKITGTQMAIGAILLLLFLRTKNRNTAQIAPPKPNQPAPAAQTNFMPPMTGYGYHAEV